MYNLHTSEEKDVSEPHCTANVLGDSPGRQASPLSTCALVCLMCSEEQLRTLGWLRGRLITHDFLFLILIAR